MTSSSIYARIAPAGEQGSLFGDLPVALPRVTEPIVREASISDGCRWWLKRAWGAGPLVCWIMANPSTADAGRDDPTMQRVMDFSLRWGFGSCVVVNVCPVISPNPAEAEAWMKRADAWMIEGDPIDQGPEWALYRRNLVEVAKLIDQTTTHVVAWGNCLPAVLVRRWLQDLAEMSDADDIELPPVEWLCLGTNENGTPRHPLARGKNRIPNDFKPIKWVSR